MEKKKLNRALNCNINEFWSLLKRRMKSFERENVECMSEELTQSLSLSIDSLIGDYVSSLIDFIDRVYLVNKDEHFLVEYTEQKLSKFNEASTKNIALELTNKRDELDALLTAQNIKNSFNIASNSIYNCGKNSIKKYQPAMEETLLKCSKITSKKDKEKTEENITHQESIITDKNIRLVM